MLIYLSYVMRIENSQSYIRRKQAIYSYVLSMNNLNPTASENQIIQ